MFGCCTTLDAHTIATARSFIQILCFFFVFACLCFVVVSATYAAVDHHQWATFWCAGVRWRSSSFASTLQVRFQCFCCCSPWSLCCERRRRWRRWLVNVAAAIASKQVWCSWCWAKKGKIKNESFKLFWSSKELNSSNEALVVSIGNMYCGV